MTKSFSQKIYNIQKTAIKGVWNTASENKMGWANFTKSLQIIKFYFLYVLHTKMNARYYSNVSLPDKNLSYLTDI